MAVSRRAEPFGSLPALHEVRERVDVVLRTFLDDRRAELAALDPSAAILVDEIRRLVDAGGKRIRPSICIWAYRAAGGREIAPVERAAAALELLHTFAVIHDDVMDGSPSRRGVETTHVRFATGGDRARGVAIAVLVGDLAAVLAEQLLRTCGARPAPLALAGTRFDRMRIEMAAGQFLDLERSASSQRVAALKTGSYTAEGPVLVATALADAGPAVERPLLVFARHLGEAFQLRDDVEDGDAPAEAAAIADDLLDRGVAALEAAPLEPGAVAALVALAEQLRHAASGAAS